MRLGSGSCVRIGQAEICIMLPLAVTVGQARPIVRGLPLPPLPGAGTDQPPTFDLTQLAAHALSRPPHRLSLGEIEQWARHAFPAIRKQTPPGPKALEWRHAMVAAMEEQPTVFELVDERGGKGEVGKGEVWQINMAAAAHLLVDARLQPQRAVAAPAMAAAPQMIVAPQQAQAVRAVHGMAVQAAHMAQAHAAQVAHVQAAQAPQAVHAAWAVQVAQVAQQQQAQTAQQVQQQQAAQMAQAVQAHNARQAQGTP